MLRIVHQLRDYIARQSPYPPALQGVVMLVLLAAPLSAIGMSGALTTASAPQRFWIMTALVAMHFLAVLLVPPRRLPRWLQLIYLSLQCGLTAAAQAIFPAPLLDYVYLTIVLQAMALFPLWAWILFAIGVWSVWSGRVIIDTASFLAWLQSNLALAFPVTCVIIAAIVYLRQLQRSEQSQQMLQQMQQRYDSLATALRELQQRVMIEERSRLAQSLSSEVQGALMRAEQSMASAMTQAQNNLQSTLAQTRQAAAVAVERLRAAVATLRRSDVDDVRPTGVQAAAAALEPADEFVITNLTNRVLTWVLPLVFIVLSLLLTLLQHRLTPEVIGPVLFFSVLLILTYIYTQRTHNPVLLHAGLAAQTLAVVAMAMLTQMLPLLLGLLLVFWQISIRLPVSQILLFLAGVPTAISLLVARLWPEYLDFEALLICAVLAIAVGGPLLLARSQMSRRRQAELQAALLAAEIEQQTAEARTLTVANERSRLAREIHDDLGSRLVLINLQLQLAEDLAGEDPGAALEQLQTSREQLHGAWQGLLAVADADLPLNGATLHDALDQLVREFRRSAVATIQLSVIGELGELSAPVAWVVYRAVQEGITNAYKHGRSRRIEVLVAQESGYVTISVTNDEHTDGTALGAPPAEVSRGSFGLIGLRERATAIGGGIEAGPQPEGGWRLRVVLPAEGV